MTVHLMKEAKGRDVIARCGVSAKVPVQHKIGSVATIVNDRVTCPECRVLSGIDPS